MKQQQVNFNRRDENENEWKNHGETEGKNSFLKTFINRRREISRRAPGLAAFVFTRTSGPDIVGPDEE